jgi:hypothetical protein
LVAESKSTCGCWQDPASSQQVITTLQRNLSCIVLRKCELLAPRTPVRPYIDVKMLCALFPTFSVCSCTADVQHCHACTREDKREHAHIHPYPHRRLGFCITVHVCAWACAWHGRGHVQNVCMCHASLCDRVFLTGPSRNS